MYCLNGVYFMIQRGCSDNLFIRYFDENYKALHNPKNNMSCGWLEITKEHADFLKSVASDELEITMTKKAEKQLLKLAEDVV